MYKDESMHSFPKTVILRHRKENLLKCSLRGLESREDLCFFTYPKDPLPDLSGYVLLALDAPELSAQDAARGLFLIDATWRYAKVMQDVACAHSQMEWRSLPAHFRTAYPRRQGDCPDPERGLASVEALFLAYRMLGRCTEGLLGRYYWKELFYQRNQMQ